MKKLFLLLLTAILFSCYSFSQSQSFPKPPAKPFSTSWSGATMRNALLNNGSERINNESSKPYYESISGSPFVNDKYLKVKINSYETNATARYDAYKDNFEVIISSNKKLFYLNKYAGNTVKFLDLGTKYIVLKEDNKNHFFRIIKESEDDLIILIKERKKLIGGKKPTSSYASYVQPFFKDQSSSFYISFDGENALEIPKRAKKFTKLFSKNGDAVKDFIKKNKLSLKNEKHLKMIFNYYKSI